MCVYCPAQRSSFYYYFVVLMKNRKKLSECTKDESTYICRFDVRPYCHRWEHSCTIFWFWSCLLSEQRNRKRQQLTDLNGSFSHKSNVFFFHCFVWRRTPPPPCKMNHLLYSFVQARWVYSECIRFLFRPMMCHSCRDLGLTDSVIP